MTNFKKFGLSENSYKKITNLFKQFSEFEKVLIFGSRALGTYREGSDIDIAVFGRNISRETLRKFKIHYDDLNLPYQLDLIYYESIDNPSLKKHIDENGISFL